MRHFTFSRRLMAFVVCVFACISANAWIVTFNADRTVATITCEASNSDNWSDITYEGLNSGEDGGTLLRAALTLNFVSTAETAISSLKAFQSGDYAATTVDYRNATFVETNGTAISYEGYDGTDYVDMTVTPTTNCMTFSYFKNCENAYLANVKSICAKCFDGNEKLTTTFTIPTTVEYIATHACDNTPLTSITIPANVKYIDTQAFQNAQIAALIAVNVEGYTYAANAAFDKQNSVGQTNSDYASYASLTFPAGSEDFFQNNNHPLDRATSLDKGAFQKWLDDHYTYAATTTHPNGWKEFINSSSTPPTPVPEGEKVVLRTFSDTQARIVPLDFRAYMVTGATQDSDGNFVLKIQQIFAIPAYTGVILYGEIDERATSFTMSTIPSWDDPNSDDYVAPYNRYNNESETVDNTTYYMKNYMVPTIEPTKLYPYYKDMTEADWKGSWPPPAGDGFKNKTTGTTVTERNFIMDRFERTSVNDGSGDYVGFFRVKAGVTCGANKAYLSMPADIFTSAKGAEALVLKPTGEQKFRDAEWNLAWDPTGNWGQRNVSGVLEAAFAGDFEDTIPNGIIKLKIVSEAESDYYSVQGVRVAKPQKGVYIKDGKKVVIK